MAVNTKSRNFHAWQKRQVEKAEREGREIVPLSDRADNDEDDAEEEEVEEESEPNKNQHLFRRHFSRGNLSPGDVGVLKEDVERPFGMFKEGTEVELVSHFRKSGEVYWEITTLACKSCSMVIRLDVPETSLGDYETRYPSVAL